MKILTNITSPEAIKSLSIEELKVLSSEIRELIIKVMSKNGGHLASNLGSVELTLALHYVFNSPLDKFIFDTSHQIYTHKIVTGRKDLFPTIRKFQGLSGFASPTESIHDHFYAGHAGTGLSLGLGVAKTRDLQKEDSYVIPILSDAPLACGLTLEALNHIPKDLKKFILILNDNGMAISHGVGTIHNDILGKFTSPDKPKKETETFFDQFHLKYLGPVDGHNLADLITLLLKAKASDQPVIVHALTIKGCGMPKAYEDPITYHGVKPFDPESGKFHPSPLSKETFPKIFGKQVLKMANEDPSLIAITPAMPGGSCLDAFMETYPDRCIDVGIAEGHAVTFAGGLAYGGMQKVICSIYATFFQRALDNLFQDVALQNLPVVFALDRAGLSPSDGTTHHGIFDISFLTAIPNVVVAQPRDGDLLKDLLESCFQWNKPACIRYPNMTTEETGREIIERDLGKGEILIKGKDVVIIALGHMCKCAHEVRNILLESNIEATIVDPIFIKPLDTNLLFQLMLDHHYFVTIEEHAVYAGLGMCVNSFVMQSGFSDIQVQNFGLPDQFIEHGSYESLMKEAGLTPEKIAKAILERFSLKQGASAREKHWNLS